MKDSLSRKSAWRDSNSDFKKPKNRVFIAGERCWFCQALSYSIIESRRTFRSKRRQTPYTSRARGLLQKRFKRRHQPLAVCLIEHTTSGRSLEARSSSSERVGTEAIRQRLAKTVEQQSVAAKILRAGSMDQRDFLKEAYAMKKLHHPKTRTVICYLYAYRTHLYYWRADEERITSRVPAGQRAIANYVPVDGHGWPGCRRNGFSWAARNILVGANNHSVKIADFGLTRLIKFQLNWLHQRLRITRGFQLNLTSDILFIELVTRGRIPYPGMTNSQLLREAEYGSWMATSSQRPQSCMKPCFSAGIRSRSNGPRSKYYSGN